MSSVVIPNILNGFAMGFIFVPLTTMSLSRLRKQEIGNASGIYNLMRNIGGSIGIATVITLLVRGAQAHQNYLGANVRAGRTLSESLIQGLQADLASKGTDAVTAHLKALGFIYRSLQQQALLMSYADNFRLMAGLAIICIPLVFLFKKVQKPQSAEMMGE